MYQLSKNGWRESVHMKLGTVGRVARLQSGANTNDRVRIAEVRRYGGVKDMVEDLGAQLLPDVVDADSRVKVYQELYDDEGQRARGFVAMRLVKKTARPFSTFFIRPHFAERAYHSKKGGFKKGDFSCD